MATVAVFGNSMSVGNLNLESCRVPVVKRTFPKTDKHAYTINPRTLGSLFKC